MIYDRIKNDHIDENPYCKNASIKTFLYKTLSLLSITKVFKLKMHSSLNR